MKIKNIKVNAYGNIENKDINLEEGINIIHGANESGKSTLLNYIISIFYGISRNKDGKALSDYEKYKPWNSNEFSGRISYKLENGEKYEIFRDFNKKNPKIYNDKLEDISDRFETDKKDGSKFFIEQMGIDKQMYLSTVVSTQEEVRLNEKNQNMLIQKIANLAGTGEDNVSYKKALIKLQEKIRDEIGTNKTSQKPINIIEKNIENLEQDLEENGLKVGELKSKVDTKGIINKIRLKRADIAWMGIELKGTNAIVKVIKADEKPEIINEEDYCNIVSNKVGVITKINAQNGTANVKVGDTVNVGTTLINRVDGRKIHRN